ncbi:TlpA disulfide reductase family protein [Aquimarina gracilis]|uniref:TlpA disulfide reductase family protein n=1 Tax=Aquimarina gracilis TaxID=874422 RepID=A0ABU5ZUA1_9FLAO|nr:TlpA disulfide reductase family protein [Aquimarina gracilis]MEB3345574.1 TlpA disulfide reductase family protein [Aquimarina gracilis]
MNFKKSSIFTSLLATTLFFSCKTEKKNQETAEAKADATEYIILGNIKNIPDSTLVYVENNEGLRDSIMLIDGKFKLTGSIEEPVQVFLRTDDRTHGYNSFWVENQTITITVDNGNLNDANIIGGPIQKEFDVLNKKNIVVNKKLDELQKNFNKENLSKEYRDSLIQKQSLYFKEIDNNAEQFIIDFPDSYVSIDLLNRYSNGWERKTVSKLFSNLSERLKNSKNGESVKHFLSLPETPKIGDKFIDFELLDPKGNPIKLSDVKGEYVMVEFWASWCVPCRKSNPKLVENYNKYKAQGFEIIGVSLDQKKDRWLQAIEQDSLPWTNVIEPEHFLSDIAQVYKVQGIPDNLIIDKNGIIVAKTLRGSQQVEDKLKELFQ